MPNSAGDGAESSSGFAFAIAGKYQQQTTGFLCGGDSGIDLFFQPLLALLVAIFSHIISSLFGWACFTVRLGIETHTGLTAAVIAH
ncbi:hypothetical protein D3C86_2071650 [compost metagenome]